MRKPQKASSTRKGILILLLAVGMLAICAGIAMLAEDHLYQSEAYATPTTHAPSTLAPTTLASEGSEATTVPQTLETQPAETTMPTLAPDAMNGKKVLNVLITGQDRRDPDEWGRSDTMILCSINAETDTVVMVSFLRDLYLKIPGWGSNRLNAAYSWGGIELLNKTLAQNFDVAIDGNIQIDFFGFIEMIDYLGGVDLELTADEAKYINESSSGANLPQPLTEGMNHLNGDQALTYSRIRYLDSDFVRTERQRKVLTQVMQMLQQLSWNELLDAMDVLLENSALSFTDEELLLYTLGFYPVLMDGEVISRRVPADGTWEYDTVSGMSVVKANLDKNADLLKEWLSGQSDVE